MERLSGKSVLVTGAGGGIGAAVARLAAEEGARVLLTDVRQDAVERAAAKVRGEALAVVADVTREEDAERLVGTAKERFGGLDGVVHCAGISITGTVEELSLKDFEDVMRVNVTGSFLVARASVRAMKERGGSIVLFGSTASLVGAINLASYGASKAAVLGLARNLAADYASHNIRVNCLCPGPTETDLLRGILNSDEGAHGEEAFRNRVLLQRFADPDEIARVALFLVSDDASYVTGSAMTADGGFTTI